MDTTEKVLTTLIDSMHKHMAAGHGRKKVDATKELQKAVNKTGAEDAEATPKEDTFFEKFLKSSVQPKNRRRTEIAMISSKPSAEKPIFKKKK